MGENGMTPADMAAVNGNGMNNGWEGMIWLFAILAMMGGGFNWGGNRGYEQYATRDQVQNGFDTQNLQAQTRDILAAVNAASMAVFRLLIKFIMTQLAMLEINMMNYNVMLVGLLLDKQIYSRIKMNAAVA